MGHIFGQFERPMQRVLDVTDTIFEIMDENGEASMKRFGLLKAVEQNYNGESEQMVMLVLEIINWYN